MKQITTLLCMNPEPCAGPDLHNAVNAQLPDTETALRRNPVNFDSEGHHLAPNGKVSNLPYELWLAARTPAFREWFGEWEHTCRISKWLANDNALTITPDAYSGLYELNWRSAKKYALDNLRGQYTVQDNGAVIALTRKGISEVISENMGSELGLKLIAYIPDIIRNSIFIYTEKNQKDKNTFDFFEYYLTDIKTEGIRYTVKSAVGVKDERRYYTFNLSEIKDKGAFINPRPVSDIQPGRPTSQGSLSDIKDTRLLSILQADSSKAVDENGEPEVVHHFSLYDNSHSRVNMEDIHTDAFLNLRHPVRNNAEADGEISAMRDIFACGKYDGAITIDRRTGERKYIVLNSDQILSADSLCVR